MRKGEKEIKDKRILEGRETEMKVERAGMWDDEKRAEDRDRNHLSVKQLNCENKREMHSYKNSL